MQAVLYICHGSRVPAATAEAIEFVEKTMKLVDAPIQEYCFLELASPSISEGVRQCVEQGATKIAVVPVLLLTAAHAKQDIPQELEVEKNQYPEIKFSYGRPLGVNDRMVDAVLERIHAKSPDVEGLDILLIGRGSSDQDAVADTQEIVDLLQSQLPKSSSVRKCFLAAAQPKFEEALVERVQSGAERIMLVPYLLFTGILMTGIEKTVNELELQPAQEVLISDYLGSHPNVCETLKMRVEEAIKEGDSHATMA
ncbi:sirohydrochlorin chelatase [Aquibacillus sediminis]|uniref:sirohydrochlorin chelatase n=1 Tax=Aquibacillus sediminis TaxID=2574734 RepID=UPI001107B7BF|nr:sirohydrochlorin chelatase [Aquibacillus sediminis]